MMKEENTTSSARSAEAPKPKGNSASETFEMGMAILFGLIFVGFSFIVAIETVARKLFSFSLQGADELGGYALAIGSTIAFCLALLGRNHIRVDVLHCKFHKQIQSFLNWFAAVSMAVFAGFMVWLTYLVVIDTIDFQSTAATPWATPLIWPQSVWIGCMVLFFITALFLALHASSLYFRGAFDALNVSYQPKSVKEELKEELQNIEQRGAISEREIA